MGACTSGGQLVTVNTLTVTTGFEKVAHPQWQPHKARAPEARAPRGQSAQRPERPEARAPTRPESPQGQSAHKARAPTRPERPLGQSARGQSAEDPAGH